MDADWYEDPLGRFDGRFFDGEQWTDQVSVDGTPATDPEWDGPTAQEPAVRSVAKRPSRRASTAAESPVRTVAVLDESIVSSRGQSQSSKARPWRWFALAALAAAVVLVVFFTTRGRDDTDAAVELGAAEAERVEDLEGGGLLTNEEAAQTEPIEIGEQPGPADPAVTAATFDASEAMQVGALRVVNGESLLEDLERWHLNYAAEEHGLALGPASGCWFGQLGDVSVQVVQCGPVAGDNNTEYLFDLVPLLFIEVDGGYIAQPFVDDVTPNAVIANALTLVAHPNGTQPPELFVTTRGERDQAGAN